MKLRKELISSKKAAIILALVLVLGLLARIYVITRFTQGPNTHSDDNGYLTGAITFVKTGYVSYSEPDQQTAAICLGMPFLLGGLIKCFGYTPAGLILVHIVFSCISLVSAVAVYLLGTLLLNRLSGLIGATYCALQPSLLSVSCVFLTETPYVCLNLFAMYFLIRWAEEEKTAFFWSGVLCMIAAAMFKGLALLVLIVPAVILLRRKTPVLTIMKHAALILTAFVLCFTPWWVRNYQKIGYFVPFTANRGDIQLMGSYMGIGYPEGNYEDKVVELDAEAWINGYPFDTERRFARRGEVGKERLSQWFEENPVSFVFSHVVYKPFMLVTSHLQTIPIVPEKLGRLAWYACLLLALWGLICPRFGTKINNSYYVPLVYLGISVFATAIYAPLARYGVPYVPLWLMYAGAGTSDIIRRFLKAD